MNLRVDNATLVDIVEPVNAPCNEFEYGADDGKPNAAS
jgi:hypothetical protein